MKLCIISHTEHYSNDKGHLVSWGATVTEINYLTEVFDEIHHIAMFYGEKPPLSSLPYTSDKIKFVPIPVSGGHTFQAKLGIIKNIPSVLKTVRDTLNKVDCFQLRCPTGIGVYLIPYLNLFTNKPGWYKYAGNWNQEKPPLGYLIQRTFLKNQNRPVTINGHWENQPKQCYTFENPTLINKEIKEGLDCIQSKNYNGKLNFCFVGRLEIPKGVENIIKAVNEIQDISRIGQIHFVGDGKESAYFKKIASKNKVDIIFHGGLSRDKVFDIYKKCHVFLLPSTASEGFPKVIAEALCFGCIPIVSNVSAIGQYIKNDKNGLVIKKVTKESVKNMIEKVLSFDSKDFNSLLENNEELVKKFTYEHYNRRIKSEILKALPKQK
ncbi:glycosyltransferase [Wenyingzhuangia sp. IMCC45533]